MELCVVNPLQSYLCYTDCARDTTYDMPPAPRSDVFYSQRDKLDQFESISQYPENSLLREVDKHPPSLRL